MACNSTKVIHRPTATIEHEQKNTPFQTDQYSIPLVGCSNHVSAQNHLRYLPASVLLASVANNLTADYYSHSRLVCANEYVIILKHKSENNRSRGGLIHHTDSPRKEKILAGQSRRRRVALGRSYQSRPAEQVQRAESTSPQSPIGCNAAGCHAAADSTAAASPSP